MNAADIVQGALDHSEDQNAQLSSTLPAVLSEFDDGSEEAHRRLKELKNDPTVGKTWAQIKSDLGK